METTITISSGKSGFTFRVTRCHLFANLAMYTGEPEIYPPESCPEMSPGILAPQDNLVHALEDFLLDIGVVPLFFRIARAIPRPCTLQLSIDVTLYLFSLEEDCSDLDKQKLPPSLVGPCPIFLDDIHGDAESNTTTLPCFHIFHTQCIVMWFCSANVTCPLCGRNVWRADFLRAYLIFDWMFHYDCYLIFDWVFHIFRATFLSIPVFTIDDVKDFTS